MRSTKALPAPVQSTYASAPINSTKKPTELLDLPTELIAHCLSFSSPPELAKISQVSKQFANLTPIIIHQGLHHDRRVIRLILNPLMQYLPEKHRQLQLFQPINFNKFVHPLKTVNFNKISLIKKRLRIAKETTITFHKNLTIQLLNILHESLRLPKAHFSNALPDLLSTPSQQKFYETLYQYTLKIPTTLPEIHPAYETTIFPEALLKIADCMQPSPIKEDCLSRASLMHTKLNDLPTALTVAKKIDNMNQRAWIIHKISEYYVKKSDLKSAFTAAKAIPNHIYPLSQQQSKAFKSISKAYQDQGDVAHALFIAREIPKHYYIYSERLQELSLVYQECGDLHTALKLAQNSHNYDRIQELKRAIHLRPHR